MAMKLYSDSSVQAIANAIRSKNGESTQYKVGEMAQAILDIPSGGNVDYLEELCNGTLTTYSNGNVTRITNVFYGQSNLVSLSLPNATTMTGTLADCPNLESVDIKGLHSISAQYVFRRSNKLRVIVLPLVTTVSARYGLATNTGIHTYDFGALNAMGPDFMLEGNTALTTLILRKSSGIVTLGGTNRFNNTPFASAGTGGTLYVPQSLVNSYQSATNWSTILGYENNQILPIEGSIYETQYADGTPIE